MFDNLVSSMLSVCANVFGSDVIYIDNSETTYELTGIFSNEYEGVDPENGYSVISSIPNIGIKLADWPKTPIAREKITHNSIEYLVRHTEEDGEGGAVVFLDKVVA